MRHFYIFFKYFSNYFLKFEIIFLLLLNILSSPLFADLAYHDIFFLDRMHGWIVGQLEEKGLLMRTADGGLTWELIIIDPPDVNRLELRKVLFVNEHIGWVGDYQHHKLFRTIDGGRSWILQTLPDDCWGPYDIFFINENIGWLSMLIQKHIEPRAAIYKTVDGGATWCGHHFPSMSPFSRITFIDPLNGLAVGNSILLSTALLVHTTDGGETWEWWEGSGLGPLSDVTMVTSQNWWTIGGNSASVILYIPGDLNQCYNQFTSPTQKLCAIAFVDTLNGWAAGEGVFRTHDSGKNWYVVNDTIRSYGFAVIDAFEGWSHNARNVFHTLDGGYQWHAIAMTPVPITNQPPIVFQLFQNHPNPFKCQTTITCYIVDPGLVTLKIYDQSGREVKTLINQQHIRGRHQVRWNGQDTAGKTVSGGLYFCKLSYGSSSQIKKLLFLR